VDEIGKTGQRAIAVQADVTVESQVDQMVRTVEASLGEIDILISNAGIRFPIVPFLNYEWHDFESKLVGEMKAAFFCCRAVVPAMIKRKSGTIVMVSSGLSRHPGIGFCAHSSAKSALDAFAKSLALELGPNGIRVNVVAPGLTMTDATKFISEENVRRSAGATPLKRVAQPEDIAGAILMMATVHTGFVTGNYLHVNGGSQML
jgi:3-oxoacyl-[acyl-carrier protein] reductase